VTEVRVFKGRSSLNNKKRSSNGGRTVRSGPSPTEGRKSSFSHGWRGGTHYSIGGKRGKKPYCEKLSFTRQVVKIAEKHVAFAENRITAGRRGQSLTTGKTTRKKMVLL